jgi:ABC-2 type transport system permease protein
MMIKKLGVVTLYTFKELLKSKIFYVTPFVGLSIMLMTYVATEFTYGVPAKVAVDFGLGMLTLSSLSISLFMGANLLRAEMESRTVYMVISRPVSRVTFISGKLLGLLGVLFVNVIILSIMMLSLSYWLGGEIGPVLLAAIFFNFLEAILLMLLVVLFSLFSNTVLSTIMSVVILILGHAIKETQGTLFVEQNLVLKKMLEFYHLVLPAFYKINLKDFAVYNHSLPNGYVLSAGSYAILYSCFLFFMIIYIFNRKNLD